MKIFKSAVPAVLVSLAAAPAFAQSTTAASTALTSISTEVAELIGLATPIMITIMLAYFGLKLLAKVATFVMNKAH